MQTEKQILTDKEISQKLKKAARFDFLKKFLIDSSLFKPKKTISQKVVIGVGALILFLFVIFIFVNYPNLLSILKERTSQKQATVAAKPAVFNVKLDTKIIQGNVLAIDQIKREIRIIGQAKAGVTLITLNYSSGTEVQEIIFDGKTQEQLRSSNIKISQIKINDIIRVTAKTDINLSIKENDVSLVEIFRSK